MTIDAKAFHLLEHPDLAGEMTPAVAGHPVLPLLVEGWHAVLQAGHGHDGLMVHGGHAAVLARSRYGGTIVSAIAFWPIPEEHRWVIGLSYTSPSHRRQGVHKALWAELVNVASAAGIRRIESGHHPDNDVSAAMQRARGSVVTSIHTAFDVAAWAARVEAACEAYS